MADLHFSLGMDADIASGAEVHQASQRIMDRLGTPDPKPIRKQFTFSNQLVYNLNYANVNGPWGILANDIIPPPGRIWDVRSLWVADLTNGFFTAHAFSLNAGNPFQPSITDIKAFFGGTNSAGSGGTFTRTSVMVKKMELYLITNNSTFPAIGIMEVDEYPIDAFDAASI